MALAPTKHRFRSNCRLGTAGVFALGGATILTAVGVMGVGTNASGPPDGLNAISVTSPRVVVLKSSRTLHLFDGDDLVRSYSIDVGVVPEGDKRRRGDGRTPLGVFRVVTKNAASPYHRFLGLDYPHPAAIQRGRTDGLISPGEETAILDAHAAGSCPDWSTALGGGIGIHGHRRGSDWTSGCIAMSDEAIEELFDVLRTGDRVEILP